MNKLTPEEIQALFPYVHSLLKALKESKLTKEQVHANFIGFRPAAKLKKFTKLPASLNRVDVYLKTLKEYGFVEQDVAPWGAKGKAKVILYFITNKGRDFLNGKRE